MMGELTQKQQIISRLGQLKAERASWWPHWQDITVYLMPRSGRYFIQDRNKGWKRHNNIYDNTGSKAVNTLAAGLMGGLTSPARPWFRLATFDRDLMSSGPVKLWLAQCTRLMLDIFQRANTYRALHSIYKEIGAFGTGVCLLTPNYDRVIHHTNITVGEYAIATNWEGQVDTIYREFERPVAEIVKEFGIENVSPSVKTMYDTGSLDKWIGLVHAIEPRADRDPSRKDNKNMPWKSIYYERAGSPDTPLRESGFPAFPGLAPRWDVSGGDIYGNGPGMEALGDVKQLQQEQLRKSQGIDYMTNPPLQVPSALKNREVERLPGGVTYYDANNTTQGIKTMFDVNLNLQHLLEDIQDCRQRVKDVFFEDLFRMLSDENAANTRMTATEVAARNEEKLVMLGPVLERLHNELLDPLVSQTFHTMLRAGLVPPPPPELQGQNINVELISMLAQAQKAIATNGIDRFVMGLGQVAQFKPEVLDKFDQDSWADAYADKLGVDPELIVPSPEVALIRQQRAKQQAQVQQSALQNQGADTAQKLANAPTQGGASNALQDATSMFSGYTGQ